MKAIYADNTSNKKEGEAKKRVSYRADKANNNSDRGNVDLRRKYRGRTRIGSI